MGGGHQRNHPGKVAREQTLKAKTACPPPLAAQTAAAVRAMVVELEVPVESAESAGCVAAAGRGKMGRSQSSDTAVSRKMGMAGEKQMASTPLRKD